MQLLKYLPVVLLLLISTLMEAQSRFKYQAVVRDAEGEVLAETELDVRISIHTEFGELVFSEVHENEVTSAFGVIGLNVGGGTLEPGLEIVGMEEIDWSSDFYSLTVDLRIDGTNDDDWLTYGTSPILSVPIAMHALSVSDKDDADADPENEIQSLSLVDNVLSISDGNSVTLSSGGGSDQVLSLDGSNLSISGGNTINLAPIIESGDPTDEIQNLEINGNELSISGAGGNTITLPTGGVPQNLSLVDNVLSISDGNSVTLSLGTDNPTDEIQELQLNGANLELVSEDGTVNGSIPYNTGVADADADPSNELQTLSFDVTTNELSLTDGNTVTIPTGGTDADADPSNELQTLSFDVTTNELSLSDGNTVTIPSGGTDADADPTNEIQDISLNMATNELTISGGSTVILPTNGGVPQDLLFNDTDFELGLTGSTTTIDLKLLPDAVDDADADPTNEIQDIFLNVTTNQIGLTGSAGVVDLTPIIDNSTDDQNLESATLSGTELTIGIEGGDPVTVDLGPAIPVGGTDDQNLTGASLSGNDLTIEIEGGNSATVDLSPIVGNSTDDQAISRDGTRIILEDGGEIDLASIIPIGGTDDQNLTGASLSGNDLTIEIEGGSSATVDLSPIVGNSTDDQAISRDGTRIILEDGGEIDLASIIPVGGTDDQNLTGASLSGNDLTIEIEGGSSATVDLSPLAGNSPWSRLGDNINFEGGNVGIGTTNPIGKMELVGEGTVNQVISSTDAGTTSLVLRRLGDTNLDWNISNSDDLFISYSDDDGATGNIHTEFQSNGDLFVLGGFQSQDLQGTGERNVVADATGKLVIGSGGTGGSNQDLIFNDTDNLIGLTGSTTTVDLTPFKTLWTPIFTLSLPAQLLEISALDTQIGGEGGISVSNFEGQTAALFEGGQTAVHGKVELTESSDNNLFGVKGEVIGFFDDQMRRATAVEGIVTTGNVGVANGFDGFVTGGERGFGIQAGANGSQHAVGGRFTANGRESTRGLEINASGGNDDIKGMTMDVNGAARATGSEISVNASEIIGRSGRYEGGELADIIGSENDISGDGKLIGFNSVITGGTNEPSEDIIVGFRSDIIGSPMVSSSRAFGALHKVGTIGGSANGVDINLLGDGVNGINIVGTSNNNFAASGVNLFLNGTNANVTGVRSIIGNNEDASRAVGGIFEAADARSASYGTISRGKSIGSQSYLSGNVNQRSAPLTFQSGILSDIFTFQAASFNNSSGVSDANFDFAVLGINQTHVEDVGFSVGLAGLSESDQNTNYGVWGEAKGNSNFLNIGVLGQNSGTGVSDFAGYFTGNVRVTGNLEKAGGTFKIDHPQDPENKYLVHSFVESPDMMNIYNGNTKTDASGKSTVQLPDYFESLNIEFRYQLTVIGEFAQAIVSRKVDGNTFEIMTDKPNVEVSWQVTGVRNDPWAQKNRVVDVVDKKADKGTYLNPELYGQPQSKAFLQTNRIPSKSPKSKNSISLEESLEKIREQHKK